MYIKKTFFFGNDRFKLEFGENRRQYDDGPFKSNAYRGGVYEKRKNAAVATVTAVARKWRRKKKNIRNTPRVSYIMFGRRAPAPGLGRDPGPQIGHTFQFRLSRQSPQGLYMVYIYIM